MGKRSDFERIPRDLYRTFDPRAMEGLAPFLARSTRYVEPMAGAGDLIRQLAGLGHECVAAMDIVPLAPGIQQGDVLKLRSVSKPFDCFITNPSWKRPILHAVIRRLSAIAPTWLLFDAGWAFSQQSAPFMGGLCSDVVPIGRLRWIPDTTDDGKDDCAWYRFDSAHSGPAALHPRIVR